MNSKQGEHLPMLNMGRKSRQGSAENSHLDVSHSKFMNGEEKNSPFKQPTDDEIFHYRENEKIRKLESKRNTDKLKIWDKQTASMSNPLRNFKNYAQVDRGVSEGTGTDKEGKKKDKYSNYGEREKLLITQAADIISGRKKERENLKNQSRKKVTMSDVVDQKKEIFLVTMTTQIVNKERVKLIDQSNEKNQALEESEKMLLLDGESFKKFGDQTKQQTQDKANQASEESQLRANKVKEIKLLQQALTTLRADNNKMDESACTYKDLKKFLENLTPRDFQEEKATKRSNLLTVEKMKWIQERKRDLSTQAGNTQKTQQELDVEFKEALDRNEIEAVEEFEDNYPLYFKDPDEIIDIFMNLEESNLNMVQDTQKLETSKTEEESKKNKIETQKDEEIKKLKEDKESKKAQIKELENQINQLNLRSQSSKISLKHEGFENLEKKIIEMVKTFQSQLKDSDVVIARPEAITKENLVNYLKAIEKLLNKFIVEINSFNQEEVRNAKAQHEKSRTKTLNDKKLKDQEKVNREIMEKNKKRSENIYKKLGRKDMYRSKIAEKDKSDDEIVVNDEEEEDKKYFEP